MVIVLLAGREPNMLATSQPKATLRSRSLGIGRVSKMHIYKPAVRDRVTSPMS